MIIKKGNKIYVNQFDLQGNLIRTWPSATIASKQLGICRSDICACTRQRIKSAGKFIWKYVFEKPNLSEFWIHHPIHDLLISNLGRVRNVYNMFELIQSETDGYKRVWVGKRRKLKSVHRLVAETFHENPENKPVVDHIDNNRSNNNFENLRWATLSENALNKKLTLYNCCNVSKVIC